MRSEDIPKDSLAAGLSEPLDCIMGAGVRRSSPAAPSAAALAKPDQGKPTTLGIDNSCYNNYCSQYRAEAGHLNLYSEATDVLKTFLTPKRADLGLTILRIVTGVIFAAHGYQKFFTMGIPGVTGFFTQVGAPMPHVSAIVVASVELFGGLALILGLFTRLVAIPLAIDMLMAIVLVHFKNGLTGPTGMELVLVLMSSAIALAVAGPGALAADAIFGGRSTPAHG